MKKENIKSVVKIKKQILKQIPFSKQRRNKRHLPNLVNVLEKKKENNFCENL